MAYQVQSANLSSRAGFILLAAIVMTVFEGACRKWGYSGPGILKYLLYFSKDILFALLLFLPRGNAAEMPGMKVFQGWLQAGVIVMGIGIAISSTFGFNPVGAVLTFRSLILLPVTALLAIPRLAGLPLNRVLLLVIGLTVFNFALGIVQNRLPADHLLNRYSDLDLQVVVVDSGVRAAGTFAYITGITVMSAFGIWAGMAQMSRAVSRWQHVFAWAGLAAGFGCALVSVSRGPIVVGVAMVTAWLLGMKNWMTVLARGLSMGIICLIAAFALGLSSTFVQLTEGLIQRNSTAGDSLSDRSLGQFGGTFTALSSVPFGIGFGTQQVAGNYYATGVASFAGAEDPIPRLVLETGALGLIGYLIVCFGAVATLEAAKKQTLDSGHKAMLLATQTLLVGMFYGTVVFNHTASAFTWLIFAAVMAAPAGKIQNRVTLPPQRRWKTPQSRAQPV